MTAPCSRPAPAEPSPSDPSAPLAALDGPRPVVVRRDLGWHARLDLPVPGEACSSSRRTTKVLLRAWQVPSGEATHDALVVVSELVGNAVRHGGERVVLELELRDGVLLVVVCDDAGGLPRQRGAAEDAEGGRGLAIVAALSQEWGCAQLDDGTKRVWARVVLHA